MDDVHPSPELSADLAHHAGVSVSGLGNLREWTFEQAGRSVKVAVRPVLTTNQIGVGLDACRSDLGCGQFLHYQVQELLAQGALRRILTDYEPTPVPIHVAYPHARLLSPNVRAFIDWAVPRLRERLREESPPQRVAPRAKSTRKKARR